jgi:ribosomal protein S13
MILYKQIQLKDQRELRNSLRGIYGIGWHKSLVVCTKLGMAYPYFTNHLNIYNFFMLSCVLDGLS